MSGQVLDSLRGLGMVGREGARVVEEVIWHTYNRATNCPFKEKMNGH